MAPGNGPCAEAVAEVMQRLGAGRGRGARGLFVSVGDPALCQVIRGHLELDAVARQDADEVFAHFARDVGEYNVAIVQFYAKHRVG